VNLSFKPYPCCRFNHGGIDAALALEVASKHNISSNDIEEVRVAVSSAGYVNNCEPIERKRRPRSSVDAQFSTPYTIACALVKKRVSVADFTDDAIRDRAVLEIASRIYPFVDPEIEKKAGREISPTSIEVRMKNGQVYSAQVQYPKGHPQNQMTDNEFKSKFRSCALSASENLSSERIEQLIASLRNLEQIENVGEITALFKILQ
jgi:2-methylcitrate dehydratase PrpD